MCLFAGTVSVLLRPGIGVHRVVLSEGQKSRMRRRRVGEHLFTSCVFDPLLCLVSIFVAAVV